MRVVNYSALARYIQQEVESNIGDEVDPNTIVTAIMRLSNQVLEPEEPRQQCHSRVLVPQGALE